jgi:hypothetical protein
MYPITVKNVIKENHPPYETSNIPSTMPNSSRVGKILKKIKPNNEVALLVPRSMVFKTAR